MRFTFPTDVSFSCSKCGLCCGDTPKKVRHILLLRSDAERLASKTGMEISAFSQRASPHSTPYVYEMLKKPDGKCVFLLEKKCTVYEDRPLICRFYPFELSTGQAGTCSFRVTEECPGVSHPDTKGVGKKLASNYFKRLLKIAQAELKANSPLE